MSIRQALANIVKYNKMVYSAYYSLATMAFRAVGYFVKIDDHLLLFNSFAGRSYSDSTRALYEALRNDPRFSSYHVVWAFHDPELFEVPGATKIHTDTPKYFLTALSSRAWVTNSSIERGLSFKGNGTVFLNTWHGTPIKRMGSDIEEGNSSFKTRGKARVDAMCVQGEYEAAIWTRAFGIPDERLVRTGLPRNDELALPSPERRTIIRQKLGIPDDKLAILYCPTFREYDKNRSLGVVMRPPMDLRVWERELGTDYVMMIRAHYEVAKCMEIAKSDFAMDVTKYPSLNELIIASDMLVSDYSSVYFDYSITEKPMLHYCYDYDCYSAHRGMYFDIRKWIDGSDNEDELIGIIRDLDILKASARSRVFRDEFVDYYGDAASKTLDVLWQLLNK